MKQAPPETLDSLLAASGLPSLEARVLAAHALLVDRAWLVAHGAERLDESARSKIGALLERRRRGEPVAYITGEREFYGLALRVTPAVLIPRPETEVLVEAALEVLPAAGSLLDLGTGSGAVAIAIAVNRPHARVAAADTSAPALEIARANAMRHGARVRFSQGDWLSGFAAERFDVVASNPPYVAAGDAHLQRGDLRFEPRAALEAGPSGMDCIDRIVREAIASLVPGGWLVLEHGHDQGATCAGLLRSAGYEQVSSRADLSGTARVARGRRPMQD